MIMSKQKPSRNAILNRSHPLARGLVGAWLMNEGAGEVVRDLSGFGNHGAFVDGPTWQSNGINFTDTLTEYIDIGTDPVLLPDAFSIVSRTIIEENMSNAICSWGGTYGSLRLPNDTANDRPLLYMAQHNWQYFNSIAAYYDKEVTIAATMPGGGQTDVTNSKLYINGEDLGAYSNYTNDTQDAKVRFRIGALPALYYKGTIKYFYLYDRELTAEEALWLYAEPYDMFYDPNNKSINFPTKKYWDSSWRLEMGDQYHDLFIS